MNEFLCHENGGKITKASRVKIESNSDPVSSGATLEHFPKNTVFVNKQMLWLMIREIKNGFPSHKMFPLLKMFERNRNFFHLLLFKFLFWHNRFWRVCNAPKRAWFLWPAVTGISACIIFLILPSLMLLWSGFSDPSNLTCRILRSLLNQRDCRSFNFLNNVALHDVDVILSRRRALQPWVKQEINIRLLLTNCARKWKKY